MLNLPTLLHIPLAIILLVVCLFLSLSEVQRNLILALPTHSHVHLMTTVSLIPLVTMLS